MLFKWIKEDEESKAPGYAHSMVGVGKLTFAFLFFSETTF